ncbi:MAG: TrkH family potassium uptake protein [Spirochaetia bacterium]
MIHPKIVLHVVAIFILILSGFLLVPLAVSLIYNELECTRSFAYTIIGSAAIAGLVFFVTVKKRNTKMSFKDSFLLVVLSWITASLVGALPFVLSGGIPSYTDAFFETMSGFTTTGASILTEIDSLPKSLLFWRSLTHWLGGMGIVVLTVAVLPLLGIAGVQLVQAESPGPSMEKIYPKITGMAKLLWTIYLGLTVLETVLLMFGGMDLFNALTHTFGTLATGGFSPQNTSVGHFDSAYIDVVITIFMLAAGLNFAIYYRVFLGKFSEIKKNTEMKAYLAIFVIATVLTCIPLVGSVYPDLWQSLRFSGFQVASILTTTGYATADFDTWPGFSKFVLFALMFIGGSAGSTGGGIKVIRIVTIFKQSIIELKYLIFPRKVFKVHINKGPVRKDFIYTVFGFVFLYFLMLMITTGVVASGGYEILTSFTTALATVGNIGPGFDLIGPAQNYAFFPGYIKWFLSLAMMVGRLEVYTVLVIFTGFFWKR